MDQTIEESKKTAFEENLKIKKNEEEEKQKIEFEKKIVEEEEKQEQAFELNEKQLKKQLKSKNLPKELDLNDSSLSAIIIKYPSGKQIQKNWDKNTIVLQIYNFIDTTEEENLKENSYTLRTLFGG